MFLYYLEHGEKLQKPSKEEKLEMIKRHIQMEVEEKGEEVAIKEMRKQVSWYIKNLKNAAMIREKINQICKEKEMVQVLTEYFENQ